MAKNLISCSDKIYIHDGISSTILFSFSAPTATEGLAFNGTNLVSCNAPVSGDHKIWIHNGISATISSSFISPDTYPKGLAFDGANLISCTSNLDKIWVHDGVSSTILSSFAAPTTFQRGLAFDGTNLISCDDASGSNKIWVHDGVSSTILSSFAAPATNTRGLTVGPESKPFKPTGLKCEGQVNPTNITDRNPEFYATYKHPYGYQGKYVRIQIATDINFFNIVWDSGKVHIPGDLVNSGTSNVYIGSSKYKFPLDGTTYYWRCKFWDDSDNEGDWSYP